jgi:hypothetical protein
MSKHHFLCVGVALFFPILTRPAPVQSADYDWKNYNGHKYALTLNYGTWETCEAEAVAQGGHLAAINDANENAWLTEFIEDADLQGGGDNLAWIGYRNQGGVWGWVTGESVTYTNYYAGHWYDPYLYAYLHGAHHSSPGTWNDNYEHYTEPNKYPRGIIEIDLHEWHVYNGHRYALTLSYGTWEECEAEARNGGGHLANIDDANENAWLTEFIRDVLCRDYGPNDAWAYNLAWTGLSYGGPDPNYPNADPNNWFWVCGDPLTFWNPVDVFPQLGIHGYLHGAEHLQAGTWNAHIHHDRDVGANPKGIIEIDLHEWHVYNGHRYALTLSYGTWEECEAEARNGGGHLATISDANENAWLTEFIRDANLQNYVQPGGDNLAWTGYRNHGGVWGWETGEPVTYTHYSWGWYDPFLYAYLHGANHDFPGEWNDNYEHYTNPNKYPRGIIELDMVVLQVDVDHGAWGRVDANPPASLPPPLRYLRGTVVTLTAMPNSGKSFKEWTIYDPNYPGDVSHARTDSNNPLVIVMNTDRQIDADFQCGSGTGLMAPLMAACLLVLLFIGRRR